MEEPHMEIQALMREVLLDMIAMMAVRECNIFVSSALKKYFLIKKNEERPIKKTHEKKTPPDILH